MIVGNPLIDRFQPAQEVDLPTSRLAGFRLSCWVEEISAGQEL